MRHEGLAKAEVCSEMFRTQSPGQVGVGCLLRGTCRVVFVWRHCCRGCRVWGGPAKVFSRQSVEPG